MYRSFVAIALLMIASVPAHAQAGSCVAAPHHQFDFWVSDWEVRQEILQADGPWIELPAPSSGRKTAGGCALIEDWHGDMIFFWEGMDHPIPLMG